MPRLACILLIVANLQGAWAQTVVTSLPEAYRMAQENSRELKQASLSADIARQGRVQSRSVLLPQIKSYATLDNNYLLPVSLIPAQIFSPQAPPGTFNEVRFGVPYNLTATLEATLPLVNTSAWHNLHIATLNAQSSEAQKAARELDLKDRISRAYYGTLLAYAAVDIAQSNLAIADSLLLTAQSRLQNGAIDPLELNRIKITRATAAASVNENKTVAENNLNALKLLLGIDIGAEVQLRERLAPARLREEATPLVPSLNVQGYPQYRVKELATRTALLQQKLEWQRRLPEVSVYTRFSAQAQRSDFNFTNTGLPWFQIGVVGLRVDLPIFTGFNRNATVQRARLNHEAARLDWLDYNQRTQAEDTELVRSYRQAQESLQTALDNLALNAANYRTARYKYDNGLFSYDQLMNVNNEQVAAQNQYLIKLGNYLTYRSRLEIKAAAVANQ